MVLSRLFYESKIEMTETVNSGRHSSKSAPQYQSIS